MKPYAIATIFAAAAVCIAPAQASPAEEYINLMNAAIQAMEDTADVLHSITDKASADAAAPKIKEIKDNLKPVVGDLQEVVSDDLAEETLQEIMVAYKSTIKKYESAQIRVFTEYKRLQDEGFYGSADLEALFAPEKK